MSRRASRSTGVSLRKSRGCAAATTRGATIATACSGAMLLAEAGLLDGHDATTHWAYCDVMRARYPDGASVHAQRALVVTGEGQRLVMAGGGTSWLDLALYLIARTRGVGRGHAGGAHQPDRLARRSASSRSRGSRARASARTR